MKKFIFLTLLIVLTFIFSQNALAVGQMTKPIVIKDVLRGQEVSAVLVLFNSEEQEIFYELIAEGQIKDWASFYKIEDEDLENPITKIQVPAKDSIQAKVKFKVPQDAPNADYTGAVTIMSVPKDEEEDNGKVSATVRLRVSREVSITVTDKEIIKFDTAVIPLKYTINKGEPLQIKIIYDNQGNVFVKPDLQLSIIRDRQIVFNAIFPYPADKQAVKPRAKETLDLIEWQTAGQKSGDYRAEVKTLLKGEVYQEEDFRFSVKGTEEGVGGIIKGIMDFKWQVEINWLIIAIALGVILLIIIIGIIRKRRI